VKADARWVNIDDRAGLVFEGSGRTVYRNLHHWDVWHAVEDELVLSEHAEPVSVAVAEEIARLTAVWYPDQAHGDTAARSMEVRIEPGELVRVDVEGFVCLCNLSDRPLDVADFGRVLPPHEPAIWQR